jgi:hypothetical protein
MCHLSNSRVRFPLLSQRVQTGRFLWRQRMFVVRVMCEGGSRGWRVSYRPAVTEPTCISAALPPREQRTGKKFSMLRASVFVWQT